MPMGADWAYSIVYLMGGEFAARLLNFAMLLALAGLLYAAVRRWLPRAAALLLVALFAASPLVQLVTGSLFVENLLAALLLAMLTAVWRFGDTGNRRFLYAAALLAGAALTTKLAALPFVALTLPFAALEVRRQWKRIGPAPCLLALLLLLATALPTYAIAWLKTGNPVFPFLNSTFPSPLLDHAAEIRDYRFREPLTWHTPFDLTFHTSRFYESQNGSLGFQYLLLAPFALVAIGALRRRPAVCAAIVALAAMTLVMRSEPNARYLYAGMPLLFIPFAVLLAGARQKRRLLYGALIACAVLCTGIDIWFLPASGWYHKKFYAHYEFRPDGFARYLDEEAPARVVVDYYDRAHPNSTMLLVSDNDLADARGTVYQNNWHQWDNWMKIQNAVNLPQMIELVDTWKLQYFIGRTRGAEFARRIARPTPVSGAVYRDRVRTRRSVPGEAQWPVRRSARAHACTSGHLRRFRPGVAISRQMAPRRRIPPRLQGTVSYSDTRGAEVALVFEGQALTYVFTRAPNRGFAEMLIDGVSKGVLDLYAPQVEWQSRYRVCCLTPGRHIAVIRTLGQARKEATGRFADLDGLIVE